MSGSVKFEFKLIDGLKLFRDRVKEERSQRVAQGTKCLSFGVQFLDEALGGIYSNDLILYGAKTGLGKTELATITAMANASAGKRVHFFALEAERNEIEMRVKYKILADCFFKVLRPQFPNVDLNFMDWFYGKLDSTLGHVEAEIEQTMQELYPSLWTYYRTGDFTIQDFEKQFLAIQDQTDLVIFDHLHFLDLGPENENYAMKEAIKKIRDLAILAGKPVVLIAHMRKSDRKAKIIAPGVDEFHGSSDITKCCTKIITLAPCHDERAPDNQWPTYVRVAKCRADGSRTRYVGLLGFNSHTSQYERGYYLGRLSPGEDEFQPITQFGELPRWAKSAQVVKA